MHNEFMAFVTDESSAAITREWAERQGLPADTVQSGGADLFATFLESDAPPKLALVDIDRQQNPSQSAARLVKLCGASTRLIAVGSANDVSLYRDMLAAGVTDYLVKPLAIETLTQAMITAQRGGIKANKQKDAKNIVIVGVRGGVGTTTVAVNVGWLIAHEMKRKCALLDLDLQYGTSALALDLEPGHGLRDLIGAPQRVDALMVASATVSESPDFAVLGAEEPIEDPLHPDSTAIMALLKELRLSYSAVIVDMPRYVLPSQRRLLTMAHEIVLVTELSLAGIRDTLRIKTTLKSLGCSARLTIVATRVGPQHTGAVDEATFAKGAQAKIDFFLPEDSKSVNAASNAGKTLGAVSPRAPLTNNLRKLATTLMSSPEEDVGPKTEKKGFLKNLFGAQNKEEA